MDRMDGIVLASASALGIQSGQGLIQFGELGLAFVLCSAIGMERELRQRSAGLKTHTVVGVAAALIMLVSKYGFTDVVVAGNIVLDPSRVAAQIVSGIGFVGGGLIFVRRDMVRGLTTAAVVWLTAAVGMACGAGLPLLAVGVTAGHFIVIYGFTPLARRLPRSRRVPSEVRLTYRAQAGVLRQALVVCTTRGFSVADVSVDRSPDAGWTSGRGKDDEGARPADAALASVVMQVLGTGSVADLAQELSELDGMVAVRAGDVNEDHE
jgi:putative Mg2+ transporter-C (MgtC) family protein